MGQTTNMRRCKSLCDAGNLLYLYILVNFNASGFGSAFPIRIRIQDSQIYSNLCGSEYTKLIRAIFFALLLVNLGF